MTSARLLLVDDSDVNLLLYRSVLAQLTSFDLQVDSHHSSIRALEAAREKAYDVIVVDYQMPELDGLTFMKRLVAETQDNSALVVMVTADKDRDIRQKALEYGATDFLNKPIDRLEFLARVRNLVTLATHRRLLSNRAEHLAAEVAAATNDLQKRELETIIRLTRAAEFRDDVTGMHVIRVGEMCGALARSLGLSQNDIELLSMAAPMHDIGKIATPDHILLKAGPLTQQEYEIMKMHTTAGYEILRDSESDLLRRAAEIALTHHERFDGKGYPAGLSGSQIPISGRFCSVVDVFDALSSVRPYKEAWSVDKAFAEITAGSGTYFDPEVVDLFTGCFDDILSIKTRFADGTLPNPWNCHSSQRSEHGSPLPSCSSETRHLVSDG